MSGELTIGYWLKQRRHLLGLTQADLAAKAWCSVALIRKIEAGDRRPSRHVAEKLAQSLQLQSDELALFMRLARADAAKQTTPPPSPPPALNVPSPAPGTIPTPLTSLIGRKADIDRALARFSRPNVRLLTLIGPAGVGKTRLSLHLAAELGPAFRDGVLFVPLAAISDPAMVLPSIAHAVGLDHRIHPSAASISDALHRKQILLILDNFEQVVAAATDVVELLLACPLVKVLVTSRTALSVRGEWQFPVPTLELPGDSETLTSDELNRYAAVTLFVERAEAVAPHFRLTEHNAAAVAAICRRLDGLPLAIELAAARMNIFDAWGILTRLEDRWTILADGFHDLPDRHKTLRAAIDWSFDLLSSDERILFRHLAVFRGGCTLAAIEAVCVHGGHTSGIAATSGLAAETVLDCLLSLAQKSLIIQRADGEHEPRFYMLETIREYASDLLRNASLPGEEDALRRRHALVYLMLAEAAMAEIRGPLQTTLLQRIEVEHDNLRAALAWTTEHNATDLSLRLGSALWRFWSMHGHLTEGRRWLQQILAQCAEQSTAQVVASTPDIERLEARVQHGSGALALMQSDYLRARDLLEVSLDWYHTHDDIHSRSEVVRALGTVALAQGDYGRAAQLYQESLEVCRAIGDQYGIAAALGNLGLTLLYLGHVEDALAPHEESLHLFRELGDKRRIAGALTNLALVVESAGDAQRARNLLEESLSLSQELGDRRSIAISLSNLANNTLNRGDWVQARAQYIECLRALIEVGNQEGHAVMLEGLARVAMAADQYDRATRLFGAARALRSAIGVPLPPIDLADQDHDFARLREELGNTAFTRSQAEGEAMTHAEALAFALEDAENSPATHYVEQPNSV